jgi:hypothetical protein
VLPFHRLAEMQAGSFWRGCANEAAKSTTC